MSRWTRQNENPDPGATQVVAGAPTRERRSAGFFSLGTVLTVVAALSATILGGGLASKHSDILDGNTWIVAASRDGVERLLRVNPGSGEVDLEAPSPLPKGRAAQLKQSNVTTAVVDATTGDTFAWDPVNGQWQKSTTRISGDTALHLTTTAAFSIDRARGTVRQLDPQTLSAGVGAPVSLGGPVSESVVDGSGKLWLAMPRAKRVVSVGDSDQGPSIVRRFDLPTSGSDLALTALRSGVMASDAGGQTTYRLFPERDAAERIAGVPPNTTSVSAASSDDDTGAVLDADSGTLTRVTATGDDRAQSIRLDAGLTDHRFGRPVVFAGQIYLPDFSAGKVLRSTTGGTFETFPPQRLAAGSQDFDLFVDDNRLWVNSRGADRAFSVDEAGNWTPIKKFDRKRIRPPKAEPSQEPERSKAPSAPTNTGRPDPDPDPEPTRRRPRSEPTVSPTPSPSTQPTTAAPTPSPTPAAPPGSPGNLAAAPGAGSLAVTWEAPAGGADDLTGYLVEWSGGDTNGEHTVDAGELRYPIDDLANGTTYEVSVTAISGEQKSEPSRTSATPVTTPTVQLNEVRASGIGQIAADFAVDGQNSGAVNCRILLNGEQKFDGLCPGAGSQTITGLGFSTAYTVSVEATNAQGSTASNERNVTTWAEPTVTLAKGTPTGSSQPQCTDPSCAYIKVTIANFTPGVTYQMNGTDTHDPQPLTGRTITAGANGSQVADGEGNTYFYGFQGETVTINVGDYTAKIRWTL